jgi:hypothetical protein
MTQQWWPGQVTRELTREFSKSSRNQSGILSSASSAETEILPPAPSRHTTISRFMPTSRRIVQFSDGQSAPPNAKVVYIDGAFDLFHPGHVEILKARPFLCQAREFRGAQQSIFTTSNRELYNENIFGEGSMTSRCV